MTGRTGKRSDLQIEIEEDDEIVEEKSVRIDKSDKVSSYKSSR